MAITMTCGEIWRQMSSYIDGELGPELRAAMDEHFRTCSRCRAVLDGTRNVIGLYGDQRMSEEAPLGYSYRLHRRLEENMPWGRRRFLGWAVGAAATILVAGGFEIGRWSRFRNAELRSEHAQPGTAIPPDMMVVVAEDGKTFHVAGCPFIHDKAKTRTIVAREAMREGFAPCVRCMKKYLRA